MGGVVENPNPFQGDPGSATLLRDVLSGMTAIYWYDFFLNGLFSEAECFQRSVSSDHFFKRSISFFSKSSDT